MAATATRTRKHTKFHTCAKHSWLKLETRARRAAFYVEGGPTGPACTTDDPCRLWPGTDLFVADIADGTEFPLDWPVNR